MKNLLLFILVGWSVSAISQKHIPEDFFYKFETRIIDSRSLIQNINSRSTSQIELRLEKWDIVLEPSNILDPAYRFTDENGDRINHEDRKFIPMRGRTINGGSVSITIGDGFIYGFIEEGKNMYYIEPLRFYKETVVKDEYILYNTKDIKDSAPIHCGFQEENSRKNQLIKSNNSKNRQTGLCYDIEYVIVNDWSMYNYYGAASLEARNIGIVNNVNTNFAMTNGLITNFDDDLKIILTGQVAFTCSSCRPFVVTNEFISTLSNFSNWGDSDLNNELSPNYISHDLASFWSRDFTDPGIGLGYINSLCYLNKYNVLSDISANAAFLKSQTAHQIGHNLGLSHDGSGNSCAVYEYIMSPFFNFNNPPNSWSSCSKTVINNYLNPSSPDNFINNRGDCIVACASYPVVVYFNRKEISVFEESFSTFIGGPCPRGYKEYLVPIAISDDISQNVVVNFAISGTSDGNHIDYSINSTNLTFTPGGALEQNLVVRIYDDQLIEDNETIVINMSISSGNAIVSQFPTYVIEIKSQDEIITDTGGAGENYIIGGNANPASISSGIFEGARTDVKTRFVIKKQELIDYGLKGGILNRIGFYIANRSSNDVFNNFRINLKLVSNFDLASGAYSGTTEVFNDHIFTVNDSWNYFNFHTPFDWDGISDLYVEVCFDNSNSIGGNDAILAYNPGTNNELTYVISANEIDNCGEVTQIYQIFDAKPLVALREEKFTQAETMISSFGNGELKVGETANLFSNSGKIIASIKNIGSNDMQCVTASINTAGINKSSFSFDPGEYTNKTIHIESEGNSTYELTTFFTDEELAIWGSEKLSLNFIQSTSTIDMANINNSSIVSSQFIFLEIGAENTVAFKSTFTGDGYFALTNVSQFFVQNDISNVYDQADLVLSELGSGFLLKNSIGDQYSLKVDGAGSPIINLDNSLNASTYLPSGDLFLSSPGKSLVLKAGEELYTKLGLSNQGEILITNVMNIPNPNVEIESGYFGIEEAGAGIIFKKAEGECYKMFVNNTGHLQMGITLCPD